MCNIKEIVADLGPKMELYAQHQAGVKKGRSFVIQEPLKEESVIAFVSKKPMGKVASTKIVTNNEYGTFGGKIQSIEDQARRVINAKPVEKVDQPQMVFQNTSTIHQNIPPVPMTGDNNTPNVLSLNKSISKVSNLIKDWLHIEDAFNQVKSNIVDKKMYAENFYIKIQNCVYHSLREFCGITKDDANNDLLPVAAIDSEYYQSLIFFDRMFNDRSVSYEKIPNKVMEKYRRTFADADGIQPEWVKVLQEKIISKNLLDEHGVAAITFIIMNEWCSRILTPVTVTVTPPQPSTPKGVQISTPVTQVQRYENMNTDLQREDDIDYGGDEEEEDEYLRVSIVRDEDIDIIKIESSDGFGKVAIPFYTRIASLPKDEIIPSIADDRNGKWDWLIHFVPDLIFKTKNPDQYLAANEEDPYENKIKCVIMDEDAGIHVIGVYYVDTIISIAGDEEVEDFSDETINVINYLVNAEIATGHMSHLTRSLNSPDFFRDEEYILAHIMGTTIADDGDDEEDDVIEATVVSEPEIVEQAVVPADEIDLATRAAIESMTGVVTGDPLDITLMPTGIYNKQEEEDIHMDHDVVQVGGRQFEEESFTFVPIQRKQKFQD